MRPLMAIALLGLLAASLAGCADDPERFPDGAPTPSTTSRAATTSSSAPTTSASSSSSTSNAPTPNQGPTGTITVALNGTNATFTLNATDPEGDALVWDLDFGDGNATNGTQLPAVLNHTYVVNGTANLTATFTVTDGTTPVALTANVTFGSAGGPPIVLSGSYPAPDPTELLLPAGMGGCLFSGSPAPGAPELFGNVVDVPAEAIGGAYVGEASASSRFYFASADAAVVNDGAVTGTVPADTVELWVCAAAPNPSPAPVAWTVTVTPA